MVTIQFSETVSFLAKREESDLLAAGFLDDKIIVFKGSTFEKVQTIVTEYEEITSLSFHDKSDMILASFKNGSSHMWSAPTGKQMASFYGHHEEVTDAQFTVDSKQVVTISMDTSLRVWSPKNSEEKLKLTGNKFHQGGIICLKLCDDGKQALTAGVDCTVVLSNIEDGKLTTVLTV